MHERNATKIQGLSCIHTMRLSRQLQLSALLPREANNYIINCYIVATSEYICVTAPCATTLYLHFQWYHSSSWYTHTPTCSKPWQLDTSLRTFSSARSRDLSSSLSLFSKVNMSHLNPSARRWNSAWKQERDILLLQCSVWTLFCRQMN